METKSNWLNEKYDRIEELTTDFSMSKYNLLKISFLKRLLEESGKRKESCPKCQSNLVALEEMIEEIPHLDDIDHREPYEKKFNAIRKHFHKDHGFIPPYHFSTRWTIGGVLFGVVAATIVSYFVNDKILLDPVLAGSAFGLIVGYLIGSSKEVSYRKTKKII